jgi:hypothetical protein
MDAGGTARLVGETCNFDLDAALELKAAIGRASRERFAFETIAISSDSRAREE